MPIRASDEHCRLALTAAHRLSDKPANNNTDVLLASQLVISFSGLFNNTPVPATDILASQLAQHFVDYLQANANELGIAPTFRLYLDTDNVAKLIITPARCSPASPHLRRPHVLLTAINLKYVWTTTDPSPDARIHPFAPNIALPFRLLLDNVTQRFCTWQLVRRYPLIFGPWAQQLDVERPYFKKLFRSVSRIATRSTNGPFRKNCTRQFKMMQEQQEPSSEDDTDAPALDDEEVLCLSMELCYRSHLRRPRFKGSGHTVAANPGSDDDDELSQDLITSQSSQQFDEDFLWPDAALPIADNSDFDLLPLPAHNADVKPMTIQDPFDFWHDSDNEDEDLLDLSSSMPASSNSDTSSFATSITSFFGSDRQDYGEDALDWDEDSDVNMDHGACHRERSPDAPHLHTGPTLSPSAMFADDGSEPDLSFKTAFPGLSSKQCEAGDDDLELAFESDEEAHDPEGLERMVDASTCELEHQGSEIGTEDNCGVAEAKGLLEEDDWM